ncbi:hypothetical protein KIN20_003653 [Parelaphostrongylus tenuis]|uniref:Uncharacterized protein n=1 Tax=Parelaphostrongylus tenuis TaxID=148309 RepID=A0AAD5MIN9_PARTN|nr:hypothetical protein KIN20_003653 [Parelaphostrongylus tenuis]
MKQMKQLVIAEEKSAPDRFARTIFKVLLATVVVHVWCHFLGLYQHLANDRLTRSAFLSGRNAVEAEHIAEHQSNRLSYSWKQRTGVYDAEEIAHNDINRDMHRRHGAEDSSSRLLGAFLPQHLITAARLQIATSNPHIYAEHYPHVTVAVLKEVEQRVDRLCGLNGCTKVASEGITVVFIDSSARRMSCVKCGPICATARSACEASTVVRYLPVLLARQNGTDDIIGVTVDNAILLQSNAPAHGVFLTEETRHLVENYFTLEHIGDIWRVYGNSTGPELFPDQQKIFYGYSTAGNQSTSTNVVYNRSSNQINRQHKKEKSKATR